MSDIILSPFQNLIRSNGLVVRLRCKTDNGKILLLADFLKHYPYYSRVLHLRCMPVWMDGQHSCERVNYFDDVLPDGFFPCALVPLEGIVPTKFECRQFTASLPDDFFSDEHTALLYDIDAQALTTTLPPLYRDMLLNMVDYMHKHESDYDKGLIRHFIKQISEYLELPSKQNVNPVQAT